MAKHNKSNNSSNNSSNSNSNVNQETIMSNSQNVVNSIQDLLNQAKEVAKQERKAGNLKKNEYSKLLKEQNKAIQEEKDALYLVLQGMKNDTDDIMKLQVKQTTDLNIARIKAEYKPRLDALKLDVEEVLEAGGTVSGEFIGGGIAKVTKPVSSFFGSMANRAGIKAPWSK